MASSEGVNLVSETGVGIQGLTDSKIDEHCVYRRCIVEILTVQTRLNKILAFCSCFTADLIFSSSSQRSIICPSCKRLKKDHFLRK